MSRLMARTILTMATALVLGACGTAATDRKNLDTLDADLLEGGNNINPAVSAALGDQIMVDPSLASQSNADSIRPPAAPYSAPVAPDGVATRTEDADAGEKLMHAPAPVAEKSCAQCDAARKSVTLGALAASQQSGGCAANLRYSASWAQRMPADIPLYPDARVVEAAGADGGACSLRAVSFSSAKPIQTMLDWYYTRATKAGYSGEHQTDGDQHVLGGTRERDGAAYVLFMTARADGGTDIDIVANKGS